MKRFFFTLLFLAIWLPCLMFTMSNASTQPPLPATAAMTGPYTWKYVTRDTVPDAIPPKMLLTGRFGEDGRGVEFTIQADFIEWLYSGKSARHKVRKGPVYETHIPERPYVTQWDIEHDKSLRFALAGLRFNGYFLMGLFLSLLLPPLFLLWMLADDITIVTPQERKRRDEDFLALVKIIEARAKNDPDWLQRKTIRLALLGYAVVLGSIILMIPVGLGLGAAVLILTGGNAAAAKLAFILAAVPIGFAFVMGKSLLMPRYEPPGLAVTEAAAPKLFAYLNKIIEAAHGPRFKHVYISNEMNASVSRHTGPLGFFGFGPVTLVLGLPMMQALTTEQLSGVIGHEYGHVAAKDNALGHWVYRIRTSWLVLGDRLGLEKLWYALKLNRFYHWFIGVFSAYSFALSRQCEYEADAFAAKLAGADKAASALSSFSVRADDLGRNYWRNVWKKAETDPDVAALAPYSDIPRFFAEARDHKEIIDAVMQQKTNYSETHPSTLDRVEALGAGFTAPEPLAHSAAADLLGPLEQKLAEHFNAGWRELAKAHWQKAHEDHKQVAAKYRELKDKPHADMTVDQLWELVAAADRFKDNPVIIAASEEIVRREPANWAARLNIIGLKLKDGDESQLAQLDEVILNDPQGFPAACEHAIAFYSKAARAEEAKPWIDKLHTWQYEREAAAEERGLVLATDDYEPHGLPAETVAKINAHCASFGVLDSVYLVRKKVKYLPQYPSYLVAFKLKGMMLRSQKKIQEEVNGFIARSGLDGSYLFVQADAVAGLEGKLKKTEGARVYSAKEQKKAA